MFRQKTIYGLVYLSGGLAFLLLALPIVALAWHTLEVKAWQSNTNMAVQAALEVSLSTTLVSVFVIFLAGTPLAYGLARWQSRWQAIVSAIIELPIVLPPAVAGLGLLLALGRKGLFGETLDMLGIHIAFTSSAVIIAQIFVALPFYVRSVYVGFSSIPSEMREAAFVDGADEWTALRFILLPLARRSILAGILLSWARALGEFGATILFAGSLQGETQTMSLLVYSILEQDINAAIWTALVLVGVAFSIMLLARLLLDRKPIF